jgi:hypothetical protein
VNNTVDVVIATPGHSMEAEYVKSLVATISLLNERGITFHFANKYTSRVAAAREATAMDSDFLDAFNNSPLLGQIQYKKIFWIDSDISWNPSDFLALYNSDLNIVSGVYLSDRGVPMFSGLDETQDVREILNCSTPVEVMATGFGFVCIKQGVFENMPRPWFETKFIKMTDSLSGKEIFVPFGEDYSWCLSAKDSGYNIFIDPLVKVVHHKKVAIG